MDTERDLSLIALCSSNTGLEPLVPSAADEWRKEADKRCVRAKAAADLLGLPPPLAEALYLLLSLDLVVLLQQRLSAG